MKATCCCGEDRCRHIELFRRLSEENRFLHSRDRFIVRIRDDVANQYVCRVEFLGGVVSSLEIDLLYLEQLGDYDLIAILNDWDTRDGEESEEEDWGEDGEEDWGEEHDRRFLSSDQKLERVIKRLELFIPKGTDFKIFQKESINGWTNGTDIWITSGALKHLDEGEVAALIAHELSHIHESHPQRLKDLVREGVSLTKNAWSDRGHGLIRRSLKSGLILVTAFFHTTIVSQEFELSADCEAVKILERGGYSREDLQRLLKRFNSPDSLLSSHPSLSSRYRNIDDV